MKFRYRNGRDQQNVLPENLVFINLEHTFEKKYPWFRIFESQG